VCKAKAFERASSMCKSSRISWIETYEEMKILGDLVGTAVGSRVGGDVLCAIKAKAVERASSMCKSSRISWMETHGGFVGNLVLRVKNEERDLC
jgi:hypothetical protein